MSPTLAEAPLAERCTRLVEELGLGTVRAVRPLSGGVSSDIAAVRLEDRTVCVKFALPKLRTKADWRAPVRRNAAEYRWLQRADAIAGCAPELLGRSEREGGFVMAYLEGPSVSLWKAALMADEPDRGEAERVARAIASIHAASLTPSFDRTGFDNIQDFDALRIEPYLTHTAKAHPDVAPALMALADALRQGEGALVHGDLSPKNIIFANGAPVILDAECATYTLPAFDVAFCVNHLVLKALHKPHRRGELVAMARRFIAAYGQTAPALAAEISGPQTATLLVALMLARVDGKSPVEYLTKSQAACVREIALAFLKAPPASVAAVLQRVAATP